MKRNTFFKGSIFLAIIVFGLIVITSCSKKDNKAFRLLTPDSLNTEEIEFIKGRDFIDEDEKIVFVYTMDNIKSSGTVLTINKIAVYSQESVNKENFENIFDMKKTHSLVDSINSKITISPKTGDDFTVDFKGGSDTDEKFYDILKDMWRMAISNKQEEKDTPEPKTEE